MARGCSLLSNEADLLGAIIVAIPGPRARVTSAALTADSDVQAEVADSAVVLGDAAEVLEFGAEVGRVETDAAAAIGRDGAIGVGSVVAAADRAGRRANVA